MNSIERPLPRRSLSGGSFVSLAELLSDYIQQNQLVLDINNKEVGEVEELCTMENLVYIKLKRKGTNNNRFIPIELFKGLLNQNTIQLNKTAEEMDKIALQIVGAKVSDTDTDTTTTANNNNNTNNSNNKLATEQQHQQCEIPHTKS